MTPLPFLNRLPHQLRQHGTFILTTKGLVKRFLDIERHAEVHSGHRGTPVVDYFNNRMPLHRIAVKIERGRALRSSASRLKKKSIWLMADSVWLGVEKERGDLMTPLARRAPTIKRWSLDARSQGVNQATP